MRDERRSYPGVLDGDRVIAKAFSLAWEVVDRSDPASYEPEWVKRVLTDRLVFAMGQGESEPHRLRDDALRHLLEVLKIKESLQAGGIERLSLDLVDELNFDERRNVI